MAPSNIDALFPLTPTQEGILYHALLAPEPGIYIQQYSCRIEGALDVGVLRAAWDRVTSAHQALRTMIVSEGRENPLQLVRTEVELPFFVDDLSSLPGQGQEERISEFLESDRQEGIPLDEAPMMRVKVFSLAPDRHHMVWTHHHLVIDGWSISVVLTEVFELYRRIASGDVPSEVKSGPSFQKFANHLAGRDRSEARDFWQHYLVGFDEPNQIDSTPSGQVSPWADTQLEASLDLDQELTARINSFARSRDLTLNSIVRGAWALLVSRYSGDTDVVFGATVSGRPPEIEDSLDAVGLFINTVPVRVTCSPDTKVLDWLSLIQEDQYAMSEHDWAPLPEIQTWAETKPGMPLFSSLVVMENIAGPTTHPGIEITREAYEQRSNYPLALLVFPAEQLRLLLLHDPLRFRPPLATRILRQIAYLLEQFVSSPDKSIAEVSVMTPPEVDEIVHSWNRNVSVPGEKSVVEDILAVGGRSPETLAATNGEHSISYGDLVAAADRLSRLLHRLGVGPDRRVAIHMENSPAAVVAILGVLRAGGAYVPIAPGTPVARLDALIRSTDALAVIQETSRQPAYDPGDTITIIGLDQNGNVDAFTDRLDEPEPEPVFPAPADLAYVMYTSGSTGEPKGVQVTHRNLAYSTNARDFFYPHSPQTYLLLSPFHFDSSVAGIFWTLARGGTLVIPRIGELDVHQLGRLIHENRVTHLLSLPSVYRLLIETVEPALLASLQVSIVAGEPCPPDVAVRHHQVVPGSLLVNEYGPTECTVWATAHRIDPEEPLSERVPIGRAIPGTSAFLLDDDDRLSPIGTVGELNLGGPGLSPGYLGAPDLTAKSFRTISIPTLGEIRLYRTGDLGVLRDDGAIELMGRTDAQIKIRGRRIEPGEIEEVASRHPKVELSVIRVDDDPAGVLGLSLFYTTSDGAVLEPAELRAFLIALLPSYMVPGEITPIPDIPRTPTGKVDRNALPKADPSLGGTEHLLPETATERFVLAITRDLLGHERVQITDNFFDAGGHSLLSMHLIARIYSEFDVSVSPNVILFNSLRYAATMIDESLDKGGGPEVRQKTTMPGHVRSDQPLRFGRDGGLFGMFHAPQEAERQPVLICPPIGWEYFKTHWALRNLGRQLWEEGHPVLRFDYIGTGDSAGDPEEGSVDSWLSDIGDAILELQTLARTDQISVVGLRLGATLAAMAISGTATSHLVMWDPVVSGGDHLGSLVEMHQRFFERKNQKSALRQSGNELLGSVYPENLRADLRAIDLTNHSWPTGVKTTVVASHTSESLQLLEDSADGLVDFEYVDDASGWNDLLTFNSALLPTKIPRRITELLGVEQ